MIQLKQFKNLKELMQQLGNEDAARAYMEEMRWGGDPTCPHCGHRKPYRLKDGKRFRCSAKTCKRDFSVTVGTVFEGSNVKLSTWLAALYLQTSNKKGYSSHQLARQLGVTQKTGWFITHRLRLIMDNGNDPEPLDNTVEADETYVGGKFENMNRGRRKKWQALGVDNKVAVMGLVEREGNVKLTVINNKSFKDVVRENVYNSATVITDAHLGYIGLGEEYAGHEAVNHSIQEYKRGDAHTNSVEGFFSLLKRTIYGTHHAVSPKHLHRYCGEISFRYNTRKIKDVDRFTFSLSNIKGRLKYKNLIAKTENQKKC